MAEYKRPRTKEEFEENFAQIKPLMNETQAYFESSRCLFCFDAPCVNACPTGIDIPLFIRQINSGNTLGAAKTIYDSNYFGHACGKVCPTDVLCEGACVYINQDVKPIEIGRLQSFATHKAILGNKQLFIPAKTNEKKVAVVGAGPAGISGACELRMLGFEVDIYEAKAFPSGLTLYGVAPYKITNQDTLMEMEYLQKQFGYKTIYNHPINSKEKIQYLEKNYDAILLGVGLDETTSINLPGEQLENCIGAVEFISELKLNYRTIKESKKVIVLGGGNTAMDAASESARMGAESVKLAYRRSKEEMGAYEFEYDLAKAVGVKGLFNVSPVEIIGNGKVEGVKFMRTESKGDEIATVPNSEFVEECDVVIRATGQSKMVGLFTLIEDLQLDELNRIKVNKENYQTTNPKYFAGGDAVNGGVEVVNAVAEAKIAAQGIYKYLIKT